MKFILIKTASNFCPRRVLLNPSEVTSLEEDWYNESPSVKKCCTIIRLRNETYSVDGTLEDTRKLLGI